MEIQRSTGQDLKQYVKQLLPTDFLKRIQHYRVEGRKIKESYQLNLNHGEHLSTIKKVKRFTNLTSRIIDRKWILFYPELPNRHAVPYKMCLLKGYGMTNDPSKPHILTLKWITDTYFKKYEILEKIRQTEPVVNVDSLNISKTYVTRKFEEVFGYPFAIDPLTHHGKCLCKSEINALHDGYIVHCPIKRKRKGFAYQKLVNNKYDDELFVDYRVPVFKGHIPFIYYNFRHVDHRFEWDKLKSEIVETNEVFNQAELVKIKEYCEALHLDYGELDILRDWDNGKIYVVDANNTPAGPPKKLSDLDKKKVIIRLTEAFEEAFLIERQLIHQ